MYTHMYCRYEYDSAAVKPGNSLAQIVVGTNKGVQPALGAYCLVLLCHVCFRDALIKCAPKTHSCAFLPLYHSHTLTRPSLPTPLPNIIHSHNTLSPYYIAHLTSAGAKLLKDASSEGGQDVGAVADVDGYAVTIVDIEQFNAQLA